MKLNSKEIVEVLGTFAIVASLVFVGIEIQQNSAIARLETKQTSLNQNLDISLAIATNPELTESMALLTRINSNELNMEELTSADSIRLFFVIYSALLNIQTTHDSVQEGILPESSLNGLGVGFLDNEFGRSNWSTYKTMLEPEFANWVESTLFEN